MSSDNMKAGCSQCTICPNVASFDIPLKTNLSPCFPDLPLSKLKASLEALYKENLNSMMFCSHSTPADTSLKKLYQMSALMKANPFIYLSDSMYSRYQKVHSLIPVYQSIMAQFTARYICRAERDEISMMLGSLDEEVKFLQKAYKAYAMTQAEVNKDYERLYDEHKERITECVLAVEEMMSKVEGFKHKNLGSSAEKKNEEGQDIFGGKSAFFENYKEYTKLLLKLPLITYPSKGFKNSIKVSNGVSPLFPKESSSKKCSVISTISSIHHTPTKSSLSDTSSSIPWSQVKLFPDKEVKPNSKQTIEKEDLFTENVFIIGKKKAKKQVYH
eukprot:TRINITY_DN1424_c0_g1_i1.p1 TRINITY_DN1424_c0_g1~~TRINITY_DN1424_c0_g1_i1.p1  ORF type:complete len:330 (+),score=33.69 TRINITY_DN1424_c0_g1_i1:463-1452(+)